MPAPEEHRIADGAKPPPAFSHIVLTRFNVRWDEGEDGPSIGTGPEWLARRFDLFERYCLPSLQKQSSTNFTWIIFFDKQTPEPFAAMAKALPERLPNIVPVFCGALPNRLVSDTIKDVLPEAPDWLITTRLDNDDGLHLDFVRNIQNNFHYNMPEILNFPEGIVMRSGRTYLQRHLSNAFISLSEPFLDGQTVFSIARHVYASEAYPVRQLRSGPMWLQVIHGGNISNRVRGRRVPAAIVRDGFPALEQDASPQAESPVKIFAENMTLGLARAGIDLARMSVRRGAKFLGIDVRRRAKV